MSALAPHARLVDLRTNDVVAATDNITTWSFESVLDQSPSGHIHVPLGDAGDGTSGPDSFATVALSAAGGAGIPTMPAPLALELSLSGPDGPVDFRWFGFTVERKVASNELVLELGGEDCYGSLYSTMPAGNGRTTMTDVSLADALGGAQGTIAAIDADNRNRLLSADGTNPYWAGLLVPKPGAPDWDSSARTRVTYTAVCASAVSGVSTYLDSLGDTVARAVLTVAQRVGGAVIPGDTAPQGSRGHAVVDPSDQDLNLSQVVT